MKKEKEIKAAFYFIDLGVISLLAISGFILGVSKWTGVVGTILITLISVWGTLHSNNKRLNTQT